jgi:hypothetical protein
LTKTIREYKQKNNPEHDARLGFALGECGWSFHGAFVCFKAYLEFDKWLVDRFDNEMLPREWFAKLWIFEEELLIRMRVHTYLDTDTPCRQLLDYRGFQHWRQDGITIPPIEMMS